MANEGFLFPAHPVYNTDTINIKRQYFHALLIISSLCLVALTGLIVYNLRSTGGDSLEKKVLGKAEEVLSSRTPFGQLATRQETVTPTGKPMPTPTEIPYAVSLIDSPSELIEGDNASFTWSVDGPAGITHTTTVYYGKTSYPGGLTNNAQPEGTSYTHTIKDFLKGDYTVPLRFIGNANNLSAGTYFFRVYALIEGKHYWTDEKTFLVKQAPKHEIKVISPPDTVIAGYNIAFTWEIAGPVAKTDFTTIMAGKESKPGVLDESVSTAMTPYTAVVPDFTGGSFDVPLRFIGNTRLNQTGVYYYRAFARVNNKNIWSPEYSISVK